MVTAICRTSARWASSEFQCAIGHGTLSVTEGLHFSVLHERLVLVRLRVAAVAFSALGQLRQVRNPPCLYRLGILYVLDGFGVGCAVDCDLTRPPFPKFGSRFLHAATTCGSICGKAFVACFRCGVPNIIGRIQSTAIPKPILAP
jgi:hypothetical protein